MEKKLRHPKKVKTIKELKTLILHGIGYDRYKRIFDMFQSKEDELIKIWNGPLKRESWFTPKTLKEKGMKIFDVELVKRKIAEIYFSREHFLKKT